MELSGWVVAIWYLLMASNLKLFMLVLTFSLHLLQPSFLPVEIPWDMTIINYKNHLRSIVPCSQTSLYRMLCAEHQVHRPLITGCPCGLGSQDSCKIYWSLFTDPHSRCKVYQSLITDHSLQGRKKKYLTNRANLSTLAEPSEEWAEPRLKNITSRLHSCI